METLSNGNLTITVKESGAELCSIRKGATEYMWQADPAFWKRHSPVLFPIVGSVWNGSFRTEGREYMMSQHGFARDMEFRLVSKDASCIRYRLESDSATESAYPYSFILEIGYRLSGNTVEVTWDVTNRSGCRMPFQIGAHPAFNYPGFIHGSDPQGYFTFSRNGSPVSGLEYILVKEKGCADVGHRYRIDLEDGFLRLDRHTFDLDALIIEDSQTDCVTLCTKERSPWLRVRFNAPLVGLWSPVGKDAPFVCIEPWYGRCDRTGFSGEFKDRDWVNILEPGCTFSTSYTIEIL